VSRSKAIGCLSTTLHFRTSFNLLTSSFFKIADHYYRHRSSDDVYTLSVSYREGRSSSETLTVKQLSTVDARERKNDDEVPSVHAVQQRMVRSGTPEMQHTARVRGLLPSVRTSCKPAPAQSYNSVSDRCSIRQNQSRPIITLISIIRHWET
jgi:hypothetical protein